MWLSVCVWASLIVFGVGVGCLAGLLSHSCSCSSPRPSALWDLGAGGPCPADAAFVPLTLRQPVNVAGAQFPARAAVDGVGGRRPFPPPPPPSRSRLSIVQPPWPSCRPEPGPGPHSCGDALGLRVGAGEREGHGVLTGLRAFGDGH